MVWIRLRELSAPVLDRLQGSLAERHSAAFPARCLSVEDLHQNRGFDSLRIARKGGRRDALAIHPNTAQPSAPISRRQVTPMTSTGRCSAR